MQQHNAMATITDAAQAHEPTGDPDHVSYAKDYYWTCTCGASQSTFTRLKQAEHRALSHEEYCMDNGVTTIQVR